MDTTLIRPQEERGSTTQLPSVRVFLLAFLVPIVIGALLVGLSLAILHGNNEQIGPVEAAQIQHERGGLYGSALYYRPYPYKLELYRLARPDVAIVGSSRAMSFPQEGFAAPEITLGGAVNEIADGERLIPEMLALHKPKLIIFTLDYWWFNEARLAEPSSVSNDPDISFSLKDLVAPYQWIAQGDADVATLLRTALGQTEGEPRLGAWANLDSAGFDDHGAHHYGGILTGARKHPDKQFKTTLRRLKNAKADSKFATDGRFSETAWTSLQHIVSIAQAEGVRVYFILPPVAGTVLQAMRQGRGIGLLESLRARLSAGGLSFYDFTDGASIGATDCEFVDGLHAGSVSHLRLLRAIAPDLETTPSLRGLILPIGDLDRLIAANSGRATLHDEAWSGAEIDFLDIGCVK